MSSSPDAPDGSGPSESEAPDRAAWYSRWLPLTVVVLVVVAALALISPTVRHQLGLSTTQQPQKFAALSFPLADGGTPTRCTVSGRKAQVRFVVENHLGVTSDLHYRVVLKPGPGGGKVRSRTGSVSVADGGSRQVRVVIGPRPKQAYDVSVTLPDRHVRITSHCRGRS